MLPSTCSQYRQDEHSVGQDQKVERSLELGITLLTEPCVLRCLDPTNGSVITFRQDNCGNHCYPAVGEVFLYRMRLVFSDTPAKNDMLLLSHSERSRALSYRNPTKGARFAAGRACLRQVLSRALNLPAQAIKICTESGGRHFLASESNGLFFSLSYEDQWCVIALSQQAKIGVDIQALSQSREASFRQFFAKELACRTEFSAPELDDAQIWVRMEAWGKMTGEGLGAGLRNLFSIATGLRTDPSGYYFLDFRLTDTIAGSVCVETG